MTQPTTRSIYDNPELADWLGSFEGVPDHWVNPRHPGLTDATSTPKIGRALAIFEHLGLLLPGIALALAISLLGIGLSTYLGQTVLGFEKSPISGLMVAIVIGLIIRNTVSLPAVYLPGVKFCVKMILRVGVALLGIRLSLAAAGQIGLIAFPIVIGCVLTALIAATWLGKWFGLPPRLATLIAVGTGICGVSAIVATAPSIEADDDEVSYAVATITLFGLAAMFLYPLLAYWLFENQAQPIGFFLGTAIHDTSQVAGAGLMYQQQFDAPTTLNIAVVTKLMRNLCLIAVVPIMAYMHHRQTTHARDEKTGEIKSENTPKTIQGIKWRNSIPLFILGFIAMTTLRTVGDLGEQPFGLLDPTTWKTGIAHIQTIATWCLMLAMASVGLGTGLKRLIKLGIKPFIAGLCAASIVGLASFVLIKTTQWWFN